MSNTCDNFNINILTKAIHYSANLNKNITSQYKTKKKNHFVPEFNIYQELTGSNSKAKALNQLIFWSNKSTILSDGWFFKTYQDWMKELKVSERTLRKIFFQFEKNGWIITKVKKIFGKTVKHFKVNLNNVIEALKANKNVQRKDSCRSLYTYIDLNNKDLGNRSNSVGESETVNLGCKKRSQLLKDYEEYCKLAQQSESPAPLKSDYQNNQT